MPARSELFREKVAANPANPLFRFSLGQALFEEGDFAGAIPHLEHCAAARDDWMLPRILLGKSLIAEGRSGEARTILEDALALAVKQHHDDPAAELRLLLGID